MIIVMAAIVSRHRPLSQSALLRRLCARSSSSAAAAPTDPSEVRSFLKAVGQGVEAHSEKLEAESGSFSNFLKFRGGYLKGLGIPCQKRKLILRYIEKYRQGLWRP